MKVLRFILAAAVAATANFNVATAQSATDLDATTANHAARVVIDCASMRSPRLADVAQVVGTTYDLWATFVARQRLIELARPVCARGTDLVEFVAASESATHDLRVALADADVR